MLRIALLGMILAVSTARSSEVDDNIARLEQIQATPPPDLKTTYRVNKEFVEIFSKTCPKANEGQLRTLAVLYSHLDIKIRNRDYLFEILAAAILEKNLQPFKNHPPKISFPAPTPVEPNPSLSPELADAWSSYRSSAQPFAQLKMRPQKENWYSYWSDQNAYWKGIDRMLQNKDGVDVQNYLVTAVQFCTGYSVVPCPAAAFFGLVQKKHYAEAVGAALETPQRYTYSKTSEFDLQPSLALLMPSWENLVLGAIANKVFCKERTIGQDVAPSLRMLAGHGTDTGAEMLLELAPLADPAMQSNIIRVLSTFLNTSPSKANPTSATSVWLSNNDQGISLEKTPRISVLASAEIQTKILDYLEKIGWDKTSGDLQISIAEALDGKSAPRALALRHQLLEILSKDPPAGKKIE